MDGAAFGSPFSLGWSNLFASNPLIPHIGAVQLATIPGI
jgi:hypothetical protein